MNAQFLPSTNFRNPTSSDPCEPLSLLLVEDDRILARLLIEDLQKRHCAVEWVTTIADALTRASTQPYAEIIILDLGLEDSMPEDTIKQIGELHKYSPVLVLTGYSHDAIIEAVEAVGATFAAKPTDFAGVFSFFGKTNKKWAAGASNRESRFKRIERKISTLETMLKDANE